MKNAHYHHYDEENDELPYEDEMTVQTGGYASHTPAQPLDEEEARAYSSVYDIPVSSKMKIKKPKQ